MSPRFVLLPRSPLVAAAVLALVSAASGPAVAEVPRAHVLTDEDTRHTVRLELAVSPAEHGRGLMFRESLADDEGMLFVFEDEAERTFVMRGMDFPIDIVFVGADGQITTIHGAHPDENSLDRTRYRGEARWVIEVNIGYAAERGIEPGHRVEIAYE